MADVETKYKCITDYLEELELYCTWLMVDNPFRTLQAARNYLYHKNMRDATKNFSLREVEHGLLFIRVR